MQLDINAVVLTYKCSDHEATYTQALTEAVDGALICPRCDDDMLIVAASTTQGTTEYAAMYKTFTDSTTFERQFTHDWASKPYTLEGATEEARSMNVGHTFEYAAAGTRTVTDWVPVS